jgi:exonuclease SbcD
MKAIHTADWHIGKTLHGMERGDEHLNFLSQLCNIISKEQPEVLIISGDIYDSVAPTIASQKLYNRMLLQLHATLPTMKIVVIAGNHDSSSRLELNNELWDAFDVAIVGNIERRGDEVNFEKHIIEINGHGGEPCCYVIALPYIYHANYPVIDENMEISKMQLFHQKLIDCVAKRNKHNLPIIMTGHLALSGADIRGHESKHTHLVYENIEEFGSGYDYLALGHIHHPQFVEGRTNARYAGAPFAMSFDEDYPHSVSIVEIDTHGATPKIETVEITPLIPLFTIPEEGGDIDEVVQAIENLPNKKAYIRVKLQVVDVLPMRDRRLIEERFTDIAAELCEIYPVRKQSEIKEGSVHIEKFRENSPMEIATDFYRREFGHEMDDELKEMLLASIEQAEKHKNEETA